MKLTMFCVLQSNLFLAAAILASERSHSFAAMILCVIWIFVALWWKEKSK